MRIDSKLHLRNRNTVFVNRSGDHRGPDGKESVQLEILVPHKLSAIWHQESGPNRLELNKAWKHTLGVGGVVQGVRARNVHPGSVALAPALWVTHVAASAKE